MNIILTSFLNSSAQPTTFHVTAPHEKPTEHFLEKKKPTKNTSNTSHLELEVLNASSRSSQNYPACAVQCRIHSTPVKLALTGIVFKNVLLSANIYTLLQQFSLLTPVSLVFSAYYTGSWLDHLCHKRKRTPVTQMFQCKLQHIAQTINKSQPMLR